MLRLLNKGQVGPKDPTDWCDFVWLKVIYQCSVLAFTEAAGSKTRKYQLLKPVIWCGPRGFFRSLLGWHWNLTLPFRAYQSLRTASSMGKFQFSIQPGKVFTGEKAFPMPGNCMSFGAYSAFTSQLGTAIVAKTSLGQLPLHEFRVQLLLTCSIALFVLLLICCLTANPSFCCFVCNLLFCFLLR